MVTVEGVDLEQFAPASSRAVADIRERFALEHYILCVGTLQTRKNHIRLVQAFECIQSQIPHTLVIAGRDGSGADSLRTYLADHPNPRVRLIGYVVEADLPPLYTGAGALALPSLWEGFGLPVIEAMACGTPVLTSNGSALTEIAGEAAVLIDPQDTDDIADNLLVILQNLDLRQKLIAAGYDRVKAFSWQHTAEQTISVYRSTVGKR